MSITPEAALAACARAAEAHAQTAAWRPAVQHTVRSLIDRLAAARQLPPPRLQRPKVPAAEQALDTLGTLDGWEVLDLGEVHQHLLQLTVTRHADGRASVDKKGLGARADLGSWYTPPDLAKTMCRLAFGAELDRLAQHPDPGNVLQILAIDPACGAGVFLIEAARLIATRLAERVSGTSPPPPGHLPHGPAHRDARVHLRRRPRPGRRRPRAHRTVAGDRRAGALRIHEPQRHRRQRPRRRDATRLHRTPRRRTHRSRTPRRPTPPPPQPNGAAPGRKPTSEPTQRPYISRRAATAASALDCIPVRPRRHGREPPDGRTASAPAVSSQRTESSADPSQRTQSSQVNRASASEAARTRPSHRS